MLPWGKLFKIETFVNDLRGAPLLDLGNSGYRCNQGDVHYSLLQLGNEITSILDFYHKDLESFNFDLTRVLTHLKSCHFGLF